MEDIAFHTIDADEHTKKELLFSAAAAAALVSLHARCAIKLNYHKKVLYFALNFLPWEFLLIKKLDFEKTKTT